MAKRVVTEKQRLAKNLANKTRRAARIPEQKAAEDETERLRKEERRAAINLPAGKHASTKKLDSRKKKEDIENYQSLLKLKPTHANFSILTSRLRRYESMFLRVSTSHNSYFFELLDLLHEFVKIYVGGIEHFTGTKRYVWNADAWLYGILKSFWYYTSGNHELDCHFATFGSDIAGARPQISMAGDEMSVAVVLCVLQFDAPPYDSKGRIFEASHKCHNGQCMHYRHMMFESRDDNLDRCKNGAFITCDCNTKCISVRNGCYLPCRNVGGDLSGKCHCGRTCFDHHPISRLVAESILLYTHSDCLVEKVCA